MEFIQKRTKPFIKTFKTKKRTIKIERRDCGALGSFGGGWFFEWGLSVKTGSEGLKGTILITWLVYTIRIDKKRSDSLI
ncbi:hypothetical protein D5F11_021545 [Siminovitchia terrae]|uniref:Uncharacterized protein n=1 Tax=Siminovitchia terrae TaxID=1914933 RepID=A0A429X2I9_SIMTE|nr:hypothetical protein [Siminovitchia terrae]RST57647.1 hypothetical protein D5F11_021545 [Siminovitchia terrae]